SSRVQVLVRLAQFALLIIGLGYGSIQIAGGAHYRQLADHNRLRQVGLDAPRGQILDRQGRALAENVPSYSLLIDRSRVDDLDSSLEFAGDILETPTQELRERLRGFRGVPSFKPVPLATQLSLEQVARVAVHGLEHPEFETRSEQLRLYRYAHLSAHVLGYLGQVSEIELRQPDSPFSAGDTLGKKGVERIYDALLRGTSGEQVVVVDSRGRTIQELQRASAVTGETLELTLDLELQQEAARLLDGHVGAIVALDSQTGGILAMASAPSFDPNLFSRGISPKHWRGLLEDPHRPLQNRALQNTYPPGSVYKIVMAAAALEEKVVDPSKKVFCGGFSRIYDHRYRCWKRAGHGWVDLKDSLKYSCNVYFHQLGQAMDIDTIARYSRLFGFGRRTGIDLDGEKAGLVPDRDWSRRRRGQPWYPGETISVATGQGPLLVTPLQVARVVASIANGGRLVVPHLIQGQRPKDADVQRLGLDDDVMARLHEALVAVVEDSDGTGRSASIEGFPLAGKTGTAQVVRQATWTKNEDMEAGQRDHAWFASYGPADRPEIVVVIFVEHGGGGSTVAAPLAKRLYEKYLEIDLADHRS
ncbi:MAG: penicillin-binding protein 2, partial [Acidobacteriota bacterium]